MEHWTSLRTSLLNSYFLRPELWNWKRQGSIWKSRSRWRRGRWFFLELSCSFMTWVKDSSRWKGFKRFQCDFFLGTYIYICIYIYISMYVSNNSINKKNPQQWPLSSPWIPWWAGNNFYVDSVSWEKHYIKFINSWWYTMQPGPMRCFIWLLPCSLFDELLFS